MEDVKGTRGHKYYILWETRQLQNVASLWVAASEQAGENLCCQEEKKGDATDKKVGSTTWIRKREGQEICWKVGGKELEK